MPTSFKTGGRTPAGCAEARRPKANGDRNNTIANARSMIRPPSFDLCDLHPNIFYLYLPLRKSLGAPPILACLLRQVAPFRNPAGKDGRRSQESSMLLGWNLLRLSRLRLRRLRSRLFGRLRNRLLWRLLSTNYPPRVRAGVEDFFPHGFGRLHLFGDGGRWKRGQSLLGD